MAKHESRHPIVIVGAGYSGTLTAVNLLRGNTSKGQQIVLLDQHEPMGRGLAYRCWDDNLLLNVPAGNMSALADDPEHFVAYCRAIDPAFNTGSFVSRRIYGDYLEQTLAHAENESGAILQRVSGEAVAVRIQAGSNEFSVKLGDGRNIEAGRVVLALGHFPPKNPSPTSDFYKTDAYIENPWDFAALDRIDYDRPVLILGTGHTAIDALFRLTSSSDKRKVILLSRRGLLPQGHRFSPKPPLAKSFPDYLDAVPNTIRSYLRALRLEAEKTRVGGGDWRDVINALRPHTPEIWHRLPVVERKKFLTRVVAYWDIHRHRLAPSAHQRLQRMLHSDQVETCAGRVLDYESRGNEVRVTVRQKQSGSTRLLSVGAVVNCTGPNYDINSITLPLITQLRDDGFLKQDPLKIGIEVDDKYQVINQNGQSIPNLYYIGPMLKAKFWEAIAVPELRNHAKRIAGLILSDI
jgi:uncharacterized NAD(P)/FAD-binding protein YdhS